MLAALVAVWACSDSGQPRATCDACRVEVTRLATLGDVDGPGALPGNAVAVARHADGSLLVGPAPGDQILIFDTTGRHLRSVGSQGAGPGEFRGGIWEIVRFRGDSILVSDGGNRRISTFSQDWELGWTAPYPSAYGGGSFVALATGGFVMSGEVRGAEQRLHPMHLLDADGLLVRSFGGTGEPAPPEALYPRLAPSTDGNVWAVHMTRYRLELWSPEDTLPRVIEREVEWFESRDALGRPTPDRRPPAVMQALHRDAGGRLWVAARVGADDWAMGLGPETRSPLGTYHPVIDQEIVYDTMIEVLDEATGTLLGSVRIPQIVHTFVDDGLVAVTFEDSLGVPRVELLRLTLEDG